jgi:hypothetical protein
VTGPVSFETGARPAVQSAVELCAFVDRLSIDDVGEVVFADASAVRGSIFIERGRVCWAAARGLAARLTHLLTEAARISPERMEELFLHCKREGKVLGEFLVARGIVSSEQLRCALLEHTVESMGALCSGEATAVWRPRRGGYAARFTFDTADLVARANAHVHGHEAISWPEVLAPVSPLRRGEWAAVFIRVRSAAAPLAVTLAGEWPEKSTVVMRVGKWAASALDVAGVLEGDDAFVTATEGREGAALVAWRHGDYFVVGRLLAQGPARILNHRAMARRLRGTETRNDT